MKNKGILGPNARRPSATRLHARRAVSLAVAALFAYAAYVEADDLTSAAPMGDAWTFSLSPYLWAAGINGEAGTIPGLPPADVDEGFSDIVNDLQFSAAIPAGLGGARSRRRPAAVEDRQACEHLAAKKRACAVGFCSHPQTTPRARSVTAGA